MVKKVDRKKFVRYKEGAEIYSMGLTKFQELAKQANAIYKVDKLVLVNCDIFEQYLETFKRMKEDNVEVPVIFLTASGDEDDVVAAISLGAVNYLKKPFLPKELRERIAKELEKE